MATQTINLQSINLNIIAAISQENAIGIVDKQGYRMPFHLPADLQYFKTQTWSHSIIMGYNTFLSLQKRPLTGRFNIVLSRKKPENPQNCPLLHFANSLNQAIKIAKTWHSNKIFIIGGAQLYAEALPQANKLYLSRVQISCPEANVFFPNFDQNSWQKIRQHNSPINPQNPYEINFEVWENLKRQN